MAETNSATQMNFQTEVNQLLHLVIHSLYSNKEIFLRELISNASDALDKLRFLGLQDSSLYEDNPDLGIKIETNKNLKTLTIEDNGIGMSEAEAVDHLGTIAKSGTKEFLSKLSGEQAKDSQLIGQFGVGFYSAFIAADKVTVKSRRAGLDASEGIIWESNGEGGFTIKKSPKATRGTQIILHLKDDAEDFLNDWKLKSIITKYSDHIAWPISIKKTVEPEDKTTEANNTEAENVETSKEPEWEKVNKATALWTRPKSDIPDEEYQAFYKHISHDHQDALTWSHNRVEGKNEYTTLLFIPSHAPFDLWQQEQKHGLKLYVKRVFILDEATQFLPRYLRFVRGIIDTADLPLNVSRELLQDNKIVETMKSACTKRVLAMIEKLKADSQEKYQAFWDEFGLVMKEGPIEDFANRETIAKLLQFSTTHTNDEKQTVSLDDYVVRMQEGQDKIYYVTASSHNAAKYSPHLEFFKKKGYEVLLLSDKVDEWLVNYLGEFQGKTLQSISKGKLETEEDKQEIAEQEKNFSTMLEHIKKILGERIKEVRLTHRLTESPTCIVADEHDMGLEMQRILQATGQKMPIAKPIFEINPEHPLIEKLHNITDDSKFEQWTVVLFEQAVLAEGGALENPADFVARMNQLLQAS